MPEMPAVPGQRVVRAPERASFRSLGLPAATTSRVTPTAAARQSRYIRAVMSRRALCAAFSLTRSRPSRSYAISCNRRQWECNAFAQFGARSERSWLPLWQWCQARD